VKAVIAQLLAPAYLPILFLALSWSALTPAFPQYLSGLGAGVGVVGLVVAMKGIGQVVSDLPGGFLLGRWGTRRITLASYVLTIASNLLLVWARNVAVIGFLTFVSGLATSILVTAVMALVRVRVPAELRGRALSGVGGALRVGMLIGPVIGGVVADAKGVPAIFALRVIASLAGLVAFAVGTQGDLPPERNTAGPTHSSLARLREGLRGRWHAIATVGFGIVTLSVLRSSRDIILPLWGASIGLTPTLIGVAISISAAADLLLFIPAGILSDRAGRKPVMALTLAFFSGGLLLLIPATNLVLFFLAAGAIGLGNGIGAGINMTTGADLAPDGAVAEFLGIWRLYGDLGSAAGPILVGAIAAAVALASSVAITAAVGLVGLTVVVIRAPETRDM
jgi:MFS family permease